MQVLKRPERFVIVTEQEDRDNNNSLRRCLERGWLFSECHVEGQEEQIKYRFASLLHELYTAWLLLRQEGSIQDSDLCTFVVGVVKHFSPQTRGDLRDSSSTPQSIPEAQFQQEFYCACFDYTGGWVTTFPECGTGKGRIDFFIRSKKWGIELLRDGIKLREHDDRFTQGEYDKWIEEGKMDDYILIDFCSKMPTVVSISSQLGRQPFIRIAGIEKHDICCFNR